MCFHHRGKFFFMAILLFAAIFPGVPSFGQPEDIILNHETTFEKKRRSVVRFPHGLHMENYDCQDCHHKYENGENVLDAEELEEGNPAALCSTCHGLTTNCDLHKAFHCLCLDCHVKESKSGANTGPRQCKGCHTLKVKHH